MYRAKLINRGITDSVQSKYHREKDVQKANNVLLNKMLDIIRVRICE